jgi:hypothetical protein
VLSPCQFIRKEEKNGDVPATPLDYLERVFHVPFHLPPMEREGFATLIEKLTEPLAPTDGVREKTADRAQELGMRWQLKVRPLSGPTTRPLLIAIQRLQCARNQ